MFLEITFRDFSVTRRKFPLVTARPSARGGIVRSMPRPDFRLPAFAAVHDSLRSPALDTRCLLSWRLHPVSYDSVSGNLFLNASGAQARGSR